ncbi:MAG: DUF2231 domain-containing protein [Methylococcus sp.]|nr:DUF2231 domain-containing protein [Methylococcus sp.]
MTSLGGWQALVGEGFLVPSVHGSGDTGGAGWVGLLDTMLDSATQLFGSGVSFDLLPGISALAPNIHPLLVHFPIAFLNAFVAFDLVATVCRRHELVRVASWMLYLGALGAVAAAAAGLFAAGFVPHGEDVHEILAWHERLGLTVASLAVALSFWRLAARDRFTGMASAFRFVLAWIMAIAMFFGADLGGFMVYQYGVGVKNIQSPEAEHHHHDGAVP